MAAAADRQNILFITADQWRGDCLSALGHPIVQTPNLDRLAREGTLFRRCFAQASPCGPSRASLYTGMYLHNHRAVRNGTPLDVRHSNFALELRAAGYDPVLFGYTDTAPDPRGLAPGDPRLRSYEGVLPGLRLEISSTESDCTAWARWLGRRGYKVSPEAKDLYRFAEGHRTENRSRCGQQPAFYHAEHSNTAFLTDSVLDYITLNTQSSWAVHLSYLAPHPPWMAADPFHQLYRADLIPAPRRSKLRAEEAAQHPWLAAHLDLHRFEFTADPAPELPSKDLSLAELREATAVYYGLMSEVDAQIGRLLDGLEAGGQLDNTLIIFTSDHGEQLGSHWLFGKGGYFDESYHIPLILRDPRSAHQGRQIEQFAESIDVLPSLLDWLGLPVPRQCDGRSLLPFCHGKTPDDWRRAVHWEFDFRNIAEPRYETALGLPSDHCWMAVQRGERYKYVHFPSLPPVFFDLEEDPGETRNLAGDPAWASEILGEAQAMLSWLMSSEDRGLTGMMVTPEGLKHQEKGGP